MKLFACHEKSAALAKVSHLFRFMPRLLLLPLLLSLLLLQGCSTQYPLIYFHNVSSETHYEFSTGDSGSFTATRRRLASLSDEEKEKMAHERKSVVIPEAPKSYSLFPDVYRAGYADGYAFYAIANELTFRDNQAILPEEIVGLHVMWTVELSPLRTAYIDGWRAGEGAVQRKRLTKYFEIMRTK